MNIAITYDSSLKDGHEEKGVESFSAGPHNRTRASWLKWKEADLSYTSRRRVEVEQPATLKNEFSFLELFKERQDGHLSLMS